MYTQYAALIDHNKLIYKGTHVHCIPICAHTHTDTHIHVLKTRDPMRYKHFQVTNTYTVLPDQSVPGTSTHGWWWDLLSTSTLLLLEQWDQWSHDQVTRSGDHHGNFVREKEVIRCSEAVGVLPWKHSTHHEPSPIHWADSCTVLGTAAEWNKGKQEKKDRSKRKRN